MTSYGAFPSRYQAAALIAGLTCMVFLHPPAWSQTHALPEQPKAEPNKERPRAQPKAKATPRYSVPPTFSNVPYGKHERQVLDFFKADTKEPAPLIPSTSLRSKAKPRRTRRTAPYSDFFLKKSSKPKATRSTSSTPAIKTPNILAPPSSFMSDTNDPRDLMRFIEAQADDYARALSEIRSGRKRSHWMWYIFPQFDGLGFSSTSKRYAIKTFAEAEAYLAHPILGPRLVECAEAALGVEGKTATQIFGSPDDIKLKSCATLFAHVSPDGSVFQRLLDKYFQAKRDERTLQLIASAAG